MGLTWVVQERTPVSLSGLIVLKEPKNNLGTFPSTVLLAYLHRGQAFTKGPKHKAYTPGTPSIWDEWRDEEIQSLDAWKTYLGPTGMS